VLIRNISGSQKSHRRRSEPRTAFARKCSRIGWRRELIIVFLNSHGYLLGLSLESFPGSNSNLKGSGSCAGLSTFAGCAEALVCTGAPSFPSDNTTTLDIRRLLSLAFSV